MHGSGADAEGLGRFEDARASRQLLLDTLDDIARAHAGSIDATLAITRLPLLNLILSDSASGKPLIKINGIASIWKTARAAERRLG
jgi:hypothetical protein